MLYDPEKATVDQMAKALYRFGYKTSAIRSKQVDVKQIVIQVEGFSDYNKIRLLENALERIPGVVGIETDIIKRKVTVFVQPGKVKREILVAAVTGQGVEVVTQ